MSNLIVCCLFYVFSFILLILGLMTFLVFQMDRDGLAHSLCKCEKLHNHSSLIQARIVNGNKFTSRHGLSWIVSIYFQVNSQGNQSSRQLEFTEEIIYGRICMGALLNSRMVLTAGHCAAKFRNNPASLFVAAGADHDLNNVYCSQMLPESNGSQFCNFKVKNNYTKIVNKIHLHPAYANDLSLAHETGIFKNANDIALLEVEPFDLNDTLNILPGCLPQRQRESFEGKLLGVGYESTQPVRVNKSWSSKSEESEPPEIFPLPKDTALYTTEFTQTDCKTNGSRFICVRSGFSVNCNQDSGGPLMYFDLAENKSFIVGILSHVEGNESAKFYCGPGETAAYVPVVSHMDWIKKKGLVGDEMCKTNHENLRFGLVMFLLVGTLLFCFFIIDPEGCIMMTTFALVRGAIKAEGKEVYSKLKEQISTKMT